MILPAWKQGQIERCSIRLEFTLLWLEDRRFARGGEPRVTYTGRGHSQYLAPIPQELKR